MESSDRTPPFYLDVGAIPLSDLQSLAGIADNKDRRKKIMSLTKTLSEITPQEVHSVVRMTFWEEFSAVLAFAFGVPGSALTVPCIIALICVFTGSVKNTLLAAVLILLPLAILPVKFTEESLTSWISVQILRYFSFKIVFQEQIQKDKPTILVAPPHGVFPFGNIVTLIAFPSMMGFSFRGLVTSAAFRTPIFKYFFTKLGCVDASSKTAAQTLLNNLTIGISTGGVAEVFETNSPDGNQIVLLKQRKGMIKLAFRAGADLVPCYLFGNTELLSLWTGGAYGHNILSKISRKIGFALILFWGRFGLPIPYRVPILGVMGKPISVPQKENPTPEEIESVHEILLSKMAALFEEHKNLYQWNDKKLIII